MTSYQKLKQKIVLLESDLNLVCTQPDTLGAIEVVNTVKHKKGLENALMYGTHDLVAINNDTLGLNIFK